MPTRKRRIGFIPSLDVLKIIDRISEEENLSNSKVANILIEEALSARGLIENNKKDYFINNFQNFKKEISSLQNIFNEEDFKSNNSYDDLIEYENSREHYKKFIQFLHFKKMMNVFDKLN